MFLVDNGRSGKFYKNSIECATRCNLITLIQHNSVSVGDHACPQAAPIVSLYNYPDCTFTSSSDRGGTETLSQVWTVGSLIRAHCVKQRTRLSFGIAHASDVCHLSKVETLLQSTSTSICEAILAHNPWQIPYNL